MARCDVPFSRDGSESPATGSARHRHAHARPWGALELTVIEALREARPDVVLVAGDTVTASGDAAAVRGFLAELNAPFGVWFVPGNWEHWVLPGDPTRYLPAGVRALTNAAAPVRSDVWLVGIDDDIAGLPNSAVAFADVPAGVATIAFSHSPSIFDRASKSAGLVLAGHTHGGQVRAPLLGALWLPPGSGDYEMGWYERDSSRLFVSRGLGTSILPLRFLCRPELAIIDVVPRSLPR
jgi:uncharacterized protein